jgi:hypothetical protein
MADDESLFDFNMRSLVENAGKLGQTPNVEFGEEDLVANHPEGFRILPLVNGYYNLQPGGTFSVATTPQGKHILLEGGYNALDSGHYALQYVDKRDKSFTLEGLKAKTKDNADVFLSITITYRVINPVRIVETVNPLDKLKLAAREAAASYIRGLMHREFINSPDINAEKSDEDLAKFINSEIKKDSNTSAFAIVRCAVLERKGDPELVRIYKTLQMQEMQNRADMEALELKKKLSEQQKLYEKEMARMDNETREIKTRGDVAVRRAMSEIDRINVEIEKLKLLPGYQHEENLKRYEAQVKTIEAIMQGFSRSANDPDVLQKLIDSLDKMPRIQAERPGEEPPRENPQVIENEITDDPMINLANTKRNKKRS